MKAFLAPKDSANAQSAGTMFRLGLLIFLLPFIAVAEVVVPIDSVENHVNIRISADAKSEIVGRLQQGDSLPLVHSVTGWHEVEISGGATGFISADWTNVLDEAPAPQARPADNAEAVAEDTAGDTSDTDTRDEVRDSQEQPAAVAESQEDESVADEAGPESGVAAAVDVTEEASPEAQLADTDTVSGEAAEVPVEGISTGVAEVSDPGREADADIAVAGESAGTAEVAGEAVAETPLDDTAGPQPVEAVAAEDTQAPQDENTAGPEDTADTIVVPVAATDATGVTGPQGPRGEMGPPGPPGPQGPAGAATIEGSVDFLMKFAAPTIGANSQVYDDGNNIGIGTTEPKQRLEENGNIQIHERNSSVAGLMMTQSSGETGYIMHNMASTLTIGAGSVDRITINRDGNVGIGMARPSHPMEMASGAYVSTGGVWTNSSSRERKENIAELTPEEAIAALAQLQPVEFNYKNDEQEKYVGFIAEDVPDLVATTDRQSLSTMDIVAVLTKVVQEQQKKIAELEARLDQR